MMENGAPRYHHKGDQLLVEHETGPLQAELDTNYGDMQGHQQDFQRKHGNLMQLKVEVAGKSHMVVLPMNLDAR